MTATNSNIQFTQNNVENVFQQLISSDIDLKKFYDAYLIDEYQGDLSDRLPYYDIGRIASCIFEKFKSGEVQNFESFFGSVEVILENCDHYIGELMVIGLFEDIQNISGGEIDYYKGFDKWLKPLSKKGWDELIDFWEGTEWRNKK